MRPLGTSDAPNIVRVLHDEIRRSPQSRYGHRLHAALLVAQGMTAPQVGQLLGDSPRAVEYWVHRMQERGLAGLVDAVKPGRPKRLTHAQLKKIGVVLRHSPQQRGLNAARWDGRALAAFIALRWNVQLGVRQCQRLLREHQFRLPKRRPMLAGAGAELKSAHKKPYRPGR